MIYSRRYATCALQSPFKGTATYATLMERSDMACDAVLFHDFILAQFHASIDICSPQYEQSPLDILHAIVLHTFMVFYLVHCSFLILFERFLLSKDKHNNKPSIIAETNISLILWHTG